MKSRTEVILSNHCLWLGGEIGKDDSCCAPKLPGQSYCQKHFSIVYKPTEPRKRTEFDGIPEKSKVPNL